jgi:hypothetical protein
MEIASKALDSPTTFTSFTRLYKLIFKDRHVPAPGLLIEAFLAVNEL